MYYSQFTLATVVLIWSGCIECSQPSSQEIRDKFISGDLVAADQLKLVDPEYKHLAVIIVNVNVGDLVPGIVRVFKHLLYSIFLTSKGTAIHLILITDENSQDIVRDSVKNTIGQYLSETVIKWHYNKLEDVAYFFPRIYVELVDINSIIQPNREAINTMKAHYSNNIEDKLETKIGEITVVHSPKYLQDLFYIGPHYPSAFSQLDRLMVFDVDLIVKEDLAPLYGMFEDMNRGEVIGLALDQGPYYKGLSDDLRKTGALTLENIALYQGLNTGVVLFYLERMRKNEVYQREVKSENYEKLKDSFNITKDVMNVGDQEWFNLLMWRYPQLYKILPCEYNWQQIDLTWLKYDCTAAPKIRHLFGKIHEKND